MHIRDYFLALLVALLWGFNVVAMKLGVEDFSPTFYTALRCVVTALPWVFFMPRPKISLVLLGGIGLSFGFVKIGLISLGFANGICGGTASFILQVQSFLTVIMAMIVFREKPKWHQIMGMIVALSGVALISYDQFCYGTLFAFVCVLMAAFFWACGNILVKKAGQSAHIDMLHVTVWSNLFPIVPLLGIAYGQSGGIGLLEMLQQAGWPSYFGVIYGGLLSGGMGYWLWGLLLRKYDTIQVASFSMLTPIVATISSLVVFGDQLTSLEIVGFALILSGLVLNQFIKRNS